MITFHNPATPLVKLDLTFEAGSRYQPQLCVAHAANRLIGEATEHHNADWVAEFLDFRGISIERSADVSTACLSFYFLRRYADELLPLVREMVDCPLLTPQLFQTYVDKRRQQLAINALKTSCVARNIFYSTLFGPLHPLGTYASPDDADRLTPQLVTDFWRDRYQPTPGNSTPKYWITLSGHVDDELIALVKGNLDDNESQNLFPPNSQFPTPNPQLSTPNSQFSSLPSATQASIRIGHILPFQWNDPDPLSGLTIYSQFMVLTTLLGGYFGSRLMANLREEKGYTYGIYCQSQIFRGVIVLFITADIAPQAVDDSLLQVDNELRRLQDEEVSLDELRRVCTYMRGDYLRSIDGIFELAERHRQMANAAVDPTFFDNLLLALERTTPADLQRLARQYLNPSDLLHVVVGPPLKKAPVC